MTLEADTSNTALKTSNNTSSRPRKNTRAAPRKNKKGVARGPVYIEGLDGLRALAVLAVLFFHGNAAWLPGGFIGVEVFFVLSGFLITRGLVSEWRDSGRINLAAFWRRRAMRLLPALFLMLAVIVALSSIFDPDNLGRLRGEILAAVGYVTNWFLIVDGHAYFDSWERPSLLGHLWSLAIEEQFYLVWPVAFLLGMRFLRAPALLGLIILGVVASYATMAALAEPHVASAASRAYYGTDTRVGALLLGSALAFVPLAHGAKTAPRARHGLAALGLVSLIALAGLAYALNQDSAFLYRGGFPATSLATGILIVSLTDPTSPISRLLSLPALRWLGARSYGVYLWHWPIFLLIWPNTASPLQFLVLIGITLAVAAFSYRVVETPLRRGGLGRTWQGLTETYKRPGLKGFAAGFAAVFAVALVTGAWALTSSRATEQAPAYFAQTSLRLAVTPDSFLAPDPGDFGGSFPRSIPSGPSTLVSVSGVPLPACGVGAYSPASPAEVCEDSPPVEDGAGSESELSAQAVDSEDAQRPDPPEQLSHVGSVTAVGDSVMLGAAYALVEKIPAIAVDAEVNRSPFAAISLLRALEAAGQLQPTIVVHIGTNGVFSRGHFEEIMEIAGPQRRVFFVNLKVPRPWEEPNNTMLAQATGEHANANLIDWRAASSHRPDLFWRDEIHLDGEGASFYAEVVALAIADAAAPSVG